MPNQTSKSNVFVVHGRNEVLRRSMFDFLRAITLNPIEWSKAIEMTGKGTPFVGEVLDVAMSKAQAIVVLFTGDDEAKLQEEFVNKNDPEYEKILTPQARPNVLFEAGMAFGKYPKRTILVQVQQLRPFSDIAGRHLINLNDSLDSRQDLAQRLKNAGCAVDTNGKDWHTAGKFNQPVKDIKKLKKQEENMQINFPTVAVLETIAGNSKLNVDEIKILVAMANAQESHPGSASVALIAKLVNLNGVKVSHYCENLNHIGYIHKEGFSSHNGEIYELTSEARKLLVRENII